MTAPEPMLAAANFRDGTLIDATLGRAIPLEIIDDVVDATIARMVDRFERWTNDQFTSTEDVTLTLTASRSDRIAIPRRCTAIDKLETVAFDGTVTEQDTGVYRLHSSLDDDGAERLDTYDYIELIAGTAGLVNTVNPSRFDPGTGTVLATGTFGWTVVPPDVAYAVALMVWDHCVQQRADLHRVTSRTTATESVQYAVTEPTGMPEVDEIIADFRRDSYLAVG